MNWSRKVEKYFDDKSCEYDSTHFAKNSYRYFVESNRTSVVSKLVKNKGKMLDVACGTGRYFSLFSEQFTYYGVDLSSKMIEICRKKGIENLSLGNFEELNFPRDFFDTVICINAFQYSINPEIFIEEVCKVLKKNGELILTVYNPYSPKNLVGMFKKLCFEPKRTIEDNPHFYRFSTIKNLFSKSGIKIADVVYYNYIPWKLSHLPLKSNIYNALKKYENCFETVIIPPLASEFALRLIKN